MKTAYATLKDFETTYMFKKGHLNTWNRGQGLTGEIRLIERQFGIYTTYSLRSRVLLQPV